MDEINARLFSESSCAEYPALADQLKIIEAMIGDEDMILELDILAIRYKKGIELIKLLYEKILGLDHHFSGMQTYQNILLLSNPHTYPEFQKKQQDMEHLRQVVS